MFATRLRRRMHGQPVAIPFGDGRVRLHRIVALERRRYRRHRACTGASVKARSKSPLFESVREAGIGALGPIGVGIRALPASKAPGSARIAHRDQPRCRARLLEGRGDDQRDRLDRDSGCGRSPAPAGRG